MRWGKFVLLFQAVLTLVIGIVFVLQMIQIEKYKTEKYEELSSLNLPDNIDIMQFPQFQNLSDLTERFNKAGYILFVVGSIELILIMRLMD